MDIEEATEIQLRAGGLNLFCTAPHLPDAGGEAFDVLKVEKVFRQLDDTKGRGLAQAVRPEIQIEEAPSR